MSEANTLYIVDGSAYIYRAFFAVRRLSNSKGMPTNALFGFMNMLKKLIEKEDPEYLAITFDRYDEEDAGLSFRHELYEDYKANRDSMPDDLRTQVPYFAALVEAMNIPVLIETGVEADDVIATATKHALAAGLKVVVVSADKDLMQLIGDDVVMTDTMRGRTYTTEDVEERFGVEPERVKYVLALAGDTSDNVPGVPGIGEKTAGKLIKEFGDLENLLANIDQVSGKKRKENLTEFADQARLSLELVTLKEDCDIEFDLEKLKISPPNVNALSELLVELEFHSMLKSLKRWFEHRGWLSTEPVDANGQMSLAFGAQGAQTASIAGTAFAKPDKDYETILTMEQLGEVVAELEKAERYAFDLETTSIEAMDADIVGISFAWRDHHAVYIPVAHVYEDAPEQLSLEDVLAKVRHLIEDDAKKKIGQNVKYERTVFARYGITVRGVEYDTMLMGYLLDPGKHSQGLNALSLEYLSHVPIAYEEVVGKGKSQISFAEVPLDKATEYAAEDSDITLMLCNALEPDLIELELKDLHDTLELPLVDVIYRMEHHGICVDTELLKEFSLEFDTELDELQESIDEFAEEGASINYNSPKQLREVLFDKLDLPVKKRTKSGPSTDSSVLEQLASMHPLPDLILEARSFAKLKGTYIDALPQLVREDTGRVHTNFNQTITATGRLSSSGPNLQNIPVRTSRGRGIRRAFVPKPGWKMLVADYSQIELRILAHISQDPTMLAAYQSDQDIHAYTAHQIFDVPIEEVTKEQRGVGKTINFGVIYGMGSTRLANSLKITIDQAKQYIENYFERYAKVSQLFDRFVDEARDTGVVYTMFGRRRIVEDINARGGRKAFAERVAQNTPIQGTAADIIKMAMLELDRTIQEGDLPMTMMLQVHDELVFEVDPDFLDTAKTLVKEKMEGVYELDAPLRADVGVGDNWLDAK